MQCHKFRIFKFYYHIYQNMPKIDDITTYSQSDFKKIYKCEICDIAMIALRYYDETKFGVEEIPLNRESGTVYRVQANSGTAPATVGG